MVAADTGVAPNPFGGICTLVVCKPGIRRTAQVGDWVAGTAAAGAFPTGDARNRLIYAMKVTAKMTMAQYDKRYRDRVDALYDFSQVPPYQRSGPHTAKEYETDLSGEYVLLSEHFFYFGEDAPRLPEHLRGLIKRGPGHRSVSNAQYVEPFVRWIENTYEANRLYGRPRHGGGLIRIGTLQ